MQDKLSVTLPDFRNLGVILRIAFGVEFAKFLAAYIANEGFLDALMALLNDSLFFEPILLLTLATLFVANPWLSKLPYRQGVVATLTLVGLACLAWMVFVYMLFQETGGWNLHRPMLISILLACAILAYFNWRYRVLSPALTEARLMALQARIRPHFLFNSLNTVLGLIRAEPKRAERVLENLAELYRALLSETGTLVPLGRELDLARGYAEIEAMRLGPRLIVNWQCQGAPLDALVPPLILQPLLENAVYHGIEPSESGGVVNVTVFLKGEQLSLVVRNPCQLQAQRRTTGNQMALTNIRERLALHFDAEAEMSAYEAGDEFVVQIRMPYRHV